MSGTGGFVLVTEPDSPRLDSVPTTCDVNCGVTLLSQSNCLAHKQAPLGPQRLMDLTKSRPRPALDSQSIL